jgi:hypothetical protein
MSAVRWLPSEASDAVPVFLLEIDVAGKQYRFASQAVSVTLDDGDTYSYAPGLDVDAIDSALDVVPGVDNTDSASIDVLGLPLAELYAAGRMLELGSGELSMWLPGTTWERRKVLIAGSVSSGEYGAPDEYVTLTIGAPPWLDGGSFPRGTVTDHNGETVTIPEIINDAVDDNTAGFKLTVINRSGDYPSRLLVAAGRIDVGGTLVSVYDGEGRLISAWAASGTATQSTKTTADARPYTVIDVSGIGTESTDIQDAWTGSEFYLRASAMDIGGRAGEGLSDFVAAVYTESQFELGADSVQRVEAAAPQIDLKMTVRTQATPWRVMRDEVIPLLPLAARTARGMLELFYLPMHSEQPSVGTLEAGVNVARVSRVRQVHTLRTLRSRVSVEYRGASIQGDAVAESPQAVILGSDTAIVRSGALPGVGDRRACADDLLPLYSPRLRLVHYDAAWHLGWLDLGDAVGITDTDLSLTSAPAYIVGMQHRTDGVRLSLLLY